MEEVNEFKYLGIILCKHGSMEGEIRERTVKGRQVMGALERVMKGTNVSMAVKKGIRNSVISRHCRMHQKHGHGMQHSNHELEQ